MSGDSDLLGELRVARDVGSLDDASWESLVTVSSARRVGALADLLVLPPSLALSSAVRGDIRMVMTGGCMRYGDLDHARASAPPPQWLELKVDGRQKVLDRGLAESLLRAAVREPGLELPESAWRAA